MALFNKVTVINVNPFDVELIGDADWCEFLKGFICDLKNMDFSSADSLKQTKRILNDRSRFKQSASKTLLAFLNKMKIYSDVDVITNLLDVAFTQSLCNLVCTFYEEV